MRSSQMQSLMPHKYDPDLVRANMYITELREKGVVIPVSEIFFHPDDPRTP
jgi:hypothetical protein